MSVSNDNTSSKIKIVKSLYDTSGVIKHGRIVVCGRKIVEEVLNENLLSDIELYCPENFNSSGGEIDALRKKIRKSSDFHIVPKSQFSEIDQYKTGFPILTGKLPELKNWNYSETPGCTVMIPFQNPINVGSTIRSAAALGVKRVIILKDAAHPFHPKSIRASSGSVFRLEILNGPALNDLVINYKKIKNLISMDMNGQNINMFSFPDSFFLLPGAEGQGLPQKIRNRALSIPMESGVESLNASVSVSIVLWEWMKRKR